MIKELVSNLSPKQRIVGLAAVVTCVTSFIAIPYIMFLLIVRG